MISRLLILVASTLVSEVTAHCDDLTLEQKLVISCHQVDVDSVVRLLRAGTEVNAKFGGRDTRQHFQDSWSGGWPMNAGEWTPLFALANSSRYPPSPKPSGASVAHLDWATEAQRKIPQTKIDQRNDDRIAILRILLAHGCDIDVQDSRGATALYCALYQRHADFVKLILKFKPKVNTKTGIYIDGIPDITSLHRASWSQELTQQLLELGADDTAKDGAGDTPADWRNRRSDRLGS